MASERLRIVNAHRTSGRSDVYTVQGSAADSIVQEVMYRIHRGELEDQPPNDYIVSLLLSKSSPSAQIIVNFRAMEHRKCSFSTKRHNSYETQVRIYLYDLETIYVCRDCGKYRVPSCFRSWPLYCQAAFLSFDSLVYSGVPSKETRHGNSAEDSLSWRSDMVLPLSVRDACYRQLLSEFGVDGLTRVLLDCRGLNPESLHGGELFCTWPRFVSSSRFPALLPLNGVYGLALPALTPHLQIEGFQIKPINATKEKRYHTVGSKLGVTQPSYCLKNGDTPIYTWIPKSIVVPEDGRVRIGICEGGLKPAIAAQILHQVFFGSFNRLFSTYTLLRFISEVERDSLNVEFLGTPAALTSLSYVDSGTTSNGPVCADVLHIVSAVVSNEYEVRIGWWGQDKSGRNDRCQMDIDDLLTHYPFSHRRHLSEITVHQFYDLLTPDVQSYVANHGFRERELKKAGLLSSLFLPQKPFDISQNYERIYEDDPPQPTEKVQSETVQSTDRSSAETDPSVRPSAPPRRRQPLDAADLRHWTSLQLEDLMSVLR